LSQIRSTFHSSVLPAEPLSSNHACAKKKTPHQLLRSRLKPTLTPATYNPITIQGFERF
jgi:hypothetical protein